MECERIREAISARLDGEDPGLPDGVVEFHLCHCAACAGWRERAHAVTRRGRLGGPVLGHDLAPAVLAAAPAVAGRRPGVLAQRAALLSVAVVQLAITVPLLVLGHDHDAGRHAAHELGAFDLALAIAFAVGAVRPALSAGLAWPCGIAALGLAATAITDLIAGQAPGADEAQHLVAVAGAALLFWQSRTGSTRVAGAARAASPAVTDATGRWPGWHPSRQPDEGDHPAGSRPGAATHEAGAA